MTLFKSLVFSFLSSSWVDKPEKSLLTKPVLASDLPCHSKARLSSAFVSLVQGKDTVFTCRLGEKERIGEIWILDAVHSKGCLFSLTRSQSPC